MSKIHGEKAKQESLDRMAAAAMQAKATDDETKLRHELSVPANATLDDILQLIIDAGCEPHLFRGDFDGITLWACPVCVGIFGSVQRDESTGEMSHVGYINPTLAALNGLRTAREIP